MPNDTASSFDPDDLSAVAIAYCKHSWHVLPLRPASKVPLIDRALGWTHGEHSASSDVERIRATWAKYPDANVGLAVRPSRLVVADADTLAGAQWVLSHCQEDARYRYGGPGEGFASSESPDPVFVVKTGRGTHWLWRQFDEDDLVDPIPSAGADGVAPGVQVKATGYVVGAGSVHANGRRYRWARCDLAYGKIHPLGTAPVLSRAPVWLAAAVERHRARGGVGARGSGGGWVPPPPSKTAVAHALHLLATSPVGQRNNVAHRTAHRVRDAVAAGIYGPHDLPGLQDGYWQAARLCGAGSGAEASSTARTWASVIDGRCCRG